MNWKKISWLGLRILLFVLAIWYILNWLDFTIVKELAVQTSPLRIVAAFLAVILTHFVRALRLKIILRAIKQNVPFLKALGVYSITAFWGRITPGKIGDFGKVGFFPDKKKLFPYLILERILDVLAVLVIGLPLAYLLHPNLPLVLFVLAVVFALLCVYRPFLRFVKKLMSRFVALPKKSSGILIVRLAVLSLASWLTSLFALYFVALATGIYIPVITFLAAAAAAVVVGLVSGTPGGYGTREATLAYLLYLTTGLELAVGTTIAIYSIIVVTVSEFIMFLVGNFLERLNKTSNK